MAYDKVVDSAVLDADLETVANAIRSKGGTTASLAFPAGFANAIAAIETGEVTTEVHDITIASDLTGKSSYRPMLFSGSEFVKKHYNKDGFFILMRPAGTITAGAYKIQGIAHGNKAFGVAGSNNYYGMLMQYNSGGSGASNAMTTYKITAAQPYNAGFMGNADGDVSICLPANRNLGAGTYQIILGVVE